MTTKESRESITFETYGCSANTADTASMEQYARNAGITISDDADTVVINTCAVKGPTQSAFERRVKELEKSGKKVIVSGCLAQSMPEHPAIEPRIAIGPDHLDRLPDALVALKKKQPFKALSLRKKPATPIGLPTTSDAPFAIPISQGCLSSCSFCMTKLARGNLRSRPPREIREQVTQAVELGVSEIFLTSQDTSAYGADINLTLPDLLEQLITIPGTFRIRIGMANPQHFTRFSSALWPLFESEKLYRFLHIPLQSGSEAVVEHMRRDHTAAEYLRLVDEARSNVPHITIATDIICGYPTETAKCHQDTLAALRHSTPDAVNISRFWPRPKTRAASLPMLSGAVAKTRTREVTELFHKIARAQNRRWLNWEGDVFQTELSRQGQVLGRNQAYKQVILNGISTDAFHVGEKVRVKVTDYGKFELRGQAH